MKEYSPERITADILKKAEDFFTEGGDAEDLRTVIRISSDVREFLEQKGEYPEERDTQYLMHTIEAGVESFSIIAQSCHVFIGLAESRPPETELPRSLSELRAAYLRYFELLSNEEIHPRERLNSLLSLIRLQVAFLAYFFPWGRMPASF